MRQKLACEGLVMQNISYYNNLNDIQEKNFIKMNSMKIIILLSWVANFMVIFSASCRHQEREKNSSLLPFTPMRIRVGLM